MTKPFLNFHLFNGVLITKYSANCENFLTSWLDHRLFKYYLVVSKFKPFYIIKIIIIFFY